MATPEYFRPSRRREAQARQRGELDEGRELSRAFFAGSSFSRLSNTLEKRPDALGEEVGVLFHQDWPESSAAAVAADRLAMFASHVACAFGSARFMRKRRRLNSSHLVSSYCVFCFQ